MDRKIQLTIVSPTPAALVPLSLPVLWMGQTAAMVHAAMRYITTSQTADADLKCLNSIVKM